MEFWIFSCSLHRYIMQLKYYSKVTVILHKLFTFKGRLCNVYKDKLARRISETVYWIYNLKSREFWFMIFCKEILYLAAGSVWYICLWENMLFKWLTKIATKKNNHYFLTCSMFSNIWIIYLQKKGEKKEAL